VLAPTVVSLVVAATQATSSLSTAGASAEERARQYFRQAMRDYKDGRFRDAIGEFLKADHLKPGAALIYNVAQSYEKLGDLANAIQFYRLYLERDPAASDRRAVEATIRNLEMRLRTGAPAAATATAEPRARGDPALQEAFVISLGIGGGLLALGLASGAVAAVNSGSLSGRSRPIPASKAAQVSTEIARAHDFGLAANLFFVGASIALLSAGTFFLVNASSGNRDKPQGELALRLAPGFYGGAAGLVAEGHF
jgi:tetratricopeptide (TPR) repeat protein